MQPLSVELGPGLLTTIFDGIQRPLKAIALSSGDCFIPRGVDVPALNRKTQWEFNPGKVKVTCCLHPGTVKDYAPHELRRAGLSITGSTKDCVLQLDANSANTLFFSMCILLCISPEELVRTQLGCGACFMLAISISFMTDNSNF